MNKEPLCPCDTCYFNQLNMLQKPNHFYFFMTDSIAVVLSEFPVHEEIIREDITAQRASIYGANTEPGSSQNEWWGRGDNQMTSETSVHYEASLVSWLSGGDFHLWPCPSKSQHGGNKPQKLKWFCYFPPLARSQGEDAPPRETHILEDTNCAVNPER